MPMEINYIIQPFEGDGKHVTFEAIFKKYIDTDPSPTKVWIVSSFAKQKAILRLTPSIIKAIGNGTRFKIVVGVDINGTSKEALEAILKLKVDTLIFKNNIPNHTFHPKIFVFEYEKMSIVLIGSVNLTEGGLFRNYEAMAKITYDLEKEKGLYEEHMRKLMPFLEPYGITVSPLNQELINLLSKRKDILTEFEMRTYKSSVSKVRRYLPTSPFGNQKIPSQPMPKEMLDDLIKISAKKRVEKISHDIVEFDEFYMQLNKLQGLNIPGEARIPLAARKLSPLFWGWRDNYKSIKRSKGKKIRVYYEWKPLWEIVDIDKPKKKLQENVRIYEYVDSKDFRFYSNNLVKLGADEGDIVKIIRGEETDKFIFRCELIKKTSPLYQEFLKLCSIGVLNSNRKFGFI
jgi:hypothetical protein